MLYRTGELTFSIANLRNGREELLEDCGLQRQRRHGFYLLCPVPVAGKCSVLVGAADKARTTTQREIRMGTVARREEGTVDQERGQGGPEQDSWPRTRKHK